MEEALSRFVSEHLTVSKAVFIVKGMCVVCFGELQRKAPHELTHSLSASGCISPL